MSTQTSNPQPVATKEMAEKYIQDTLLNGKLEMKDACNTLNWSFPRVRSKAMTICKKLGGEFVKESRGVYYLQTNVTPVASSKDSSDGDDSAVTNPTPEEIEKAVLDYNPEPTKDENENN